MEREGLAERLGSRAQAFNEREKERWQTAGQKLKKDLKRPGYVAAILFNVVMLWVVNNLLAWHVPFITESFVAVLPIMNASILATIVANAAFLAYDPRWFVHLTKVALNLISLAVTYILYVLYPFDFGPWDAIARVALVLAMVAVCIAVVVELFKLAFGLD